MRRRGFIAGGGAAVAWPAIGRAQGRTYRVGLVASNTTVPGGVDAFRSELQKLGYVEGKNLVLDVRWPTTSFDQEPDFAIQLVRPGPDVIAAWTTPATLAVRNAAAGIPIVMMGVGDPVGAGLVKSLAQPGGTITGISDQDTGVVVKAAELFHQVVPGVRRMGVAYNAGNPTAAAQLNALETVTDRLGINAQISEASSATEYDIAFSRFLAGPVQGVLFIPDASTEAQARKIADWALAHRLPTMFQRRMNVHAGGLMAYGPDQIEEFRQAAAYVDKILKGGRPSELAVALPAKYEVVLNTRTARTIGVTFPSAVMAGAQEVVD